MHNPGFFKDTAVKIISPTVQHYERNLPPNARALCNRVTTHSRLHLAMVVMRLNIADCINKCSDGPVVGIELHNSVLLLLCPGSDSRDNTNSW